MEKEPDLPISSASNIKEMTKINDIEASAANSDIIREADGSITNFDGIVKRMNEDVLVDYLHDILSFLLNDRSQLRIKASGCSELFLANLLRSLDNLNCKHFNKRCANMTKQVVKVLDNNADVYKCITSSEIVGGKKFVVYKKEPISKYQMSGEEDSCCSSSNLQSITENLQSDCPNHQNHKVPQDFKMRWLKTTLRFIKDESKHVYKYPEMSPMEATFVYSIITRCKEQTDISPNSYFLPLKEAMQIFGTKYFFELNYIHTDRNGKMFLMLEKVPKNIKSIIEGDKRCSHRFRNLKFIKQPKTRTSDENRATRVVSRLKNQERYKPESNRLCEPTAADFERRLKENPGVHPNLHVYYTPNLDIFNQLASKNSRQNSAVGRSAIDNVDGAGSSRGGRRDRSCSEARTDKLLKDMSVPIKSDKAIKMMYGMGWDGGALGVRGNGITEPIIPSLELMSGAGLGHTSSPKKEPRVNHQHQSGAGFVHMPPPKKVTKGNNYPHQSGVARSQTPSEKKEPLRNVQQQSGANLGQSPLRVIEASKKVEVVKAQHQNDRRHNRLEMLQYLLDTVTSDDNARELKYDRRITKKEKGYFKHLLRCANERNSIGVSDPNELRLWTSILKGMTDNPDLHLKTSISDDCKRLLLEKDDTPYFSKHKKRKLQRKASITNIPPLTEGNKKYISNDFLRHLTENYVAVYVGRHISTKAETGVTFRVVILIHLLDTVNSDRIETLIEFEKILNDKEKDYVENTVMSVGTRKKRGGSMLEEDLLQEIRYNLEGYVLRKHFIDDRTFVVRKIDRKNLEKTSLDVSYATCSTDDNDKNYLTSRCSDDSDAGHDDIFDNDDNDEPIDNNDRSVTNKGPELQQTKTQENSSTALNIETKLLHGAVSGGENKEQIELIVLDEDDDPEDTNSQVYEIMDVQGYGVETTCHSFTHLVVEDALKETKCDVSNTDNQDFEKDAEILDLATGTLEHTVSHLQTDMPCVAKHTSFYSKTSMAHIETTGTEIKSDVGSCEQITATHLEPNMHGKGDNTGIDVEAVKQNIEKIALMDAWKRDGNGKSSVFDVLKSYVEHFNKNPEMRILQNIERTEKNTESNVLNRDLKELRNESEHNVTILAGEKDGKCIGKEETNVELSDDKCKEDMETDIPETSDALKICALEDSKVNEVKYVKRVYLMPSEYPIVEVNTEFAKSVQFIISKEIDVSTELPLLKCHGVQNGVLIYSCHSENTLPWLERVCIAKNIKLVIPTNDVVRYKMSLKINSFIDYTSDKLFKMLRLYNEGLATENWVELNVNKSSDSLTFIVELDDKSLKYIKESNFLLFAGIDQVQFHPVWN
ncbi:hypothetical protein O3G_MSEX004865 [Manduca sexta]|uniref:G-patch domain-containing protein n=1 Tax=Manduca sexta TaxID=7130 RepID=A0A921YX38_MANSE|nr:hypothetical protein O3G_MSEX004865 [Manduca sexta]